MKASTSGNVDVDRVVSVLLSPGSQNFDDIVRGLVAPSPAETADNCFAALEGYVLRRSKKHKDDGVIVKAMMRLFPSASDLHSFAVRVIRENVFRQGQLHAAGRMDYYFVTTLIILDYVFIRTGGDELRSAVTMMPKADVWEAVIFAAMNYNNFGVVVAKLQADECFRRRIFVESKWTAANIRQFIETVGEILKETPPPETRVVYFAVALESRVKAFDKGEMEEADFFAFVKTSVGDDEGLKGTAVELVAARSPSLASFCSERLGRGPLPSAGGSAPTCAAPFNAALHALPGTGEVVVRDKSIANNFVGHLQRSNYFAIDIHGAKVENTMKSQIGLVAFRLRTTVYFVMPHLFPELNGSVAKALKENPRPTLVHRWERFGEELRKLFDGWRPARLIEAERVAEEAQQRLTLDLMVEKVVGGVFCSRASNYSTAMIPSAAALRHSAIRVTLLYEYIVQEKKLRGTQKREAESSSSRHSHDGDGRGKRQRRDGESRGEESHSREDARSRDRRRR